ncbi:MAG: branched-chain amino acid ABC transporter ATP-binding protein/permease [Armatimonadota bacterium]
MSRTRWWTLVFIAALGALPWLVAGRLSLSIFLFIGLSSLLAIGLTLLGGAAGQVSLGQAAFYGIGAYVSAMTTLRLGLSPWVAFPLSAAGAAAVAFLLGAPILMLRGHYLALGTLGFNIIVDVVIRNLQDLTGGPTGLTGIPPFQIGGTVLSGDRIYYFAVWSLVLGALWLGRNLIDSRIGRALAAIRASEVVAGTLGINPAYYKARVFALSAALAGFAGSLYVHYLSFVSPSPFAFEFSIFVLVMSVIGGIAHLPGAVLGAAVVTLLREFLRDVMPRFFRGGASAEYEIVAFGLLLAGVVVFAPGGAWPFIIRRLRLEAPRPHAVPVAPVEGGTDAAPEAAHKAGELVLDIGGLEKRFGGLLAVHNLSFKVHAGEIYAVIGPNGAGKTTAFNLISGVLHPTGGSIRLAGERVEQLPAYRIATMGVARTFQTPRVFPDLSVLDNVLVGMHRHLRAGFAPSMLHLSGREEAEAAGQAMNVLGQVGLATHAAQPAGALPFGQQRLLEMARALATRPRLLLLDEPASGLSAAERRALVALIRRIRAGGVTVLLVEHDVRLVMGIADRVLVLNHGERIAEDIPSHVQRDPRVIAAYLGEEPA